ncbi:formylglycine-generating enzyme family protein [Chengkuizengella axinellae]|uniref:SUMF1/EgtB/PvdO family nonheme iron enzyme n=1 Tax=Chengkuizengella axinellae TaxID=3064388 RepID=A0ABT9IZU9_9BACL|nr:SUMF1/EgtB/PvdO family nonheme iron enzyme [Chengkuizengella sp. 2205SS18-9]MDP5274848.1 SUMF1/EgtB/PvdO family nonheme iron enzyme [Chengkuizengella sp. 2205SS18-9]
MTLEVDFQWIKIPEGEAFIGSSREEIEEAHEYWKDKLLEPRYERDFKDWLMKEYPKHQVHIEAFEISDILVTNQLYKQFCDSTDIPYPESILKQPGKDDHPVWGMSYDEALSFCLWISKEMDMIISIPSEHQWEYAARGPLKTQYPWGNEFDDSVCNSIEAGVGSTTPVRKYGSGRSYFGVYDMGGNVEEWTSTIYEPYKGGDFIEDDLIETLGEKYPVLKGGSFARGGDLCRVARRHGRHPDEVFKYTGFRIIRKF